MGRRTGSINKVETLPRGVLEIRDGKHEKKPFRVTHRKLSAEFFESAELAVARKMELVALEKQQGQAALTYSRAVHADVTAARDLLPDGVTHTDAARFWCEHHTDENFPIDRAVENFLELKRSQSIKPNGWTRHTSGLKSYLDQFAVSFAGKEFADITAESILQWLNQLESQRTGEKLSAQSIKNCRTMLNNFFNFAERRKWVKASPMRRIIKGDLPTVRKSKKNPLSIEQANTLLEVISELCPRYLLHFSLRLFLGMRTAETARFKLNWIQPEQGRIIIPGWFFGDDPGTIEQGSKTGDDWAIHDVPTRFWAIYEVAQTTFDGITSVPGASKKEWQNNLRAQVLAACGLESWPHNATRDTFCTLHMSAYRSAERTALVLKHRNSQTLWQSYLGTLVPQAEAVAFFEG